MPVSGNHRPNAPIDKLTTAYAINEPVALGGDLFVVVPSVSGNRSHVVAWAPKTPLPVAGDECLVAYDESGNPWVVTWVSDLPVQPPALISALPGSPTDGEEVLFQSTAMATAGVIWRLRYRTASASTHKWEFIGGAALSNEVVTNQATASGTYVDLVTVGPSVTTPLVGDYDVRASARLQIGAEAAAAVAQLFIGAAEAAKFLVFGKTAATQSSAFFEGTVTGVAAGEVLKLKYASEGAKTVEFARRFLALTPIRVG